MPARMVVGVDAHIDPAECSVLTEISGEFATPQRADVGIGPYDAFKDSVGIFELVLVSQERFKKTESVFFRRSKRKSWTAAADF